MNSSTIISKPTRGSRTFHHKVRTGCVTCKRRKIKCDEARPECVRCRTSSLVCEGYKPPKTWTFEMPSKGPSESDFEHHLLTFSHGEGIRYMTLYAKSTRQFFTTFAPQMAYLNPAARHGLMALSAQYQASLNHINPQGSTELATKYRTDALLHYNRGMKAFARINESQVPLESLVACSLLFTGIELWPQKNMAPHVHILHGLRILQSVPSTTIHSDTLAGYMLRLLLFLAENVASYNDDFTEMSLAIDDAYIDGPWPIPNLFHDPVEAEEHVDKLLKRAARLDPMSAGENHSRRQRLWKIHGCLSLAIENSLQQCPKQTTLHHDLRSLQIHLRVIRVLLKTNMVISEMIFDSCWGDFDYILSEVEELLAYELELGSERGPISVRSTLGLLPPLFLVATKCRDTNLRHRALELLHGSRRRERSWNSCVAYMLARTAVDAEEGRSDGNDGFETDFPKGEERVCLSHVSFDRELGQITVEYRRTPWDADAVSETAVKPWIPNIDDNYELVVLSNKSLRAYGYTGTILISPRITCQCVEEPKY